MFMAVYFCCIMLTSVKYMVVYNTVGNFTFWLGLLLRLLLSLNFSLSTYLSQKVKWFRWAKTWRLTRIV